MDNPTKQEIRGTVFNESEQISIIRRAIKGRRRIVAARMTKLLGRTVSPRMFAEFLRREASGPSPAKRRTRFPLSWLRAFCEAVGSDELARYVLPESTRRAISASVGLVESREAVSRAQEALSRVQADLVALSEAKSRKAKGAKR